MDEIAVGAIAVCWAAFVVIWVGSAIRDAALRRSQPSSGPSRAALSVPISLAAFVGAAVVVLVGQVVLADLTIELVWLRLLGLALLAGSLAFAVWARQALGTSWSVGARVTGDRRLRTTGPYSITRHPIYTGLLGMTVGTALLAGGGRWLAWIGVGIVGMAAKARMEEQLLLDVFPDEYRRYRRAVPALVPGLGWLAGRLRAAAGVRRA